MQRFREPLLSCGSYFPAKENESQGQSGRLKVPVSPEEDACCSRQQMREARQTPHRSSQQAQWRTHQEKDPCSLPPADPRNPYTQQKDPPWVQGFHLLKLVAAHCQGSRIWKPLPQECFATFVPSTHPTPFQLVLSSVLPVRATVSQSILGLMKPEFYWVLSFQRYPCLYSWGLYALPHCIASDYWSPQVRGNPEP